MLVDAVAFIDVAVVEHLVRRGHEARIQLIELVNCMLVVGHARGSATRVLRGVLVRRSATKEGTASMVITSHFYTLSRR